MSGYAPWANPTYTLDILILSLQPQKFAFPTPIPAQNFTLPLQIKF